MNIYLLVYHFDETNRPFKEKNFSSLIIIIIYKFLDFTSVI